MSLGDVKLHLVDSIDEVLALKSWLGERRPIHALGCDLETSGLDKQNDWIRLAQIGDGEHGWAIPWEHWNGVLRDVVKNWDGRWIFHNGSFDVRFLSRAGVEIPRHMIDDTMPMARIVEPNAPMGLKSQTSRHVDAAAGGLQMELDKATGWTWATVPIEYQPYWTYGALDPVLAYKLYEHHWPIVQAQAPAAYELEMAVLWVIEKMERYGAHVDRAFARENYTKFIQYCEEVETWCGAYYGVKPGSNQAIIEILEADGFTFSKATKNGAKALDAEVLEGIDHPLANAVLERRRLQKMASTYLKFYIERADELDLVHPSINTLGALTSRMSMSDPNLQNLPRLGTTRAGDVVRNCMTSRFVTPELHELVARGELSPREVALKHGTLIMCDFSQIEMRLLAHLSEEPNMIAAFTSEGDFFVNLARQIFQDDTLTKKDPRRQITKNAGYATIYGAGVRKFAQTAGIEERQAREFMNRWNTMYPRVRQFQDFVLKTALQRREETGVPFITSPLTGRRYIAQQGKEYALVNYCIQGTAAETFKTKLIELDNTGISQFMVAPVHDEVILDVPGEHVLDVVNTLQGVMNDPDMFSVPVEAEVSFGLRWGKKMGWEDN